MARKTLPAQGMKKDEVLAHVGAYGERDLPWRAGRAFAYVYDPGAEVEAVSKAAYARYLTENGLDPTAFPSLLRFENDLVAMALSHLQAPEGAVGSFTSGGTESILLAVKAARERWRALHPGGGQPEMILPITAHAAFHKAAQYFDVKVVPAPVDASCRARPEAIAGLISAQTALVVASSPSYAHGVIDPIAPIAHLCLGAGIPFHVDACVGGWLLPFFRGLGAEVPAFDFSVPGVTSMSMDLHKYGFTPKGASVVLYRDPALRQHQYFACARWTGYTIINPTVQSSRSGGPVAAAWAVLHLLGHDGYKKLAADLLQTTRRLCEGIAQIPGLRLMAQPDFCMLAFTSDEFNIFHLADEMAARGFHVQPQLRFEDVPENIHLSLQPGNVPHTETFLEALAQSAAAAAALPRHAAPEHLLEMVAAAGPALEISPEELVGLMAALGVEGDRLPSRMAPIHELLNVLPRLTDEQLLGTFMGSLFHPTQH